MFGWPRFGQAHLTAALWEVGSPAPAGAVPPRRRKGAPRREPARTAGAEAEGGGRAGRPPGIPLRRMGAGEAGSAGDALRPARQAEGVPPGPAVREWPWLPPRVAAHSGAGGWRKGRWPGAVRAGVVAASARCLPVLAAEAEHHPFPAGVSSAAVGAAAASASPRHSVITARYSPASARSSSRGVHSSALCMVVPTAPSSATGQKGARKRASEVPPPVSSRGSIPRARRTAARSAATKGPGCGHEGLGGARRRRR